MGKRAIVYLSIATFGITLGASFLRIPQSAADPAGPASPTARNVIMILGDGMGLSTVSAASIYGHGRSGALFIQSLPHMGLSDTSSADTWVTDSAAGMTALITGQKTFNDVLSLARGSSSGQPDGTPLKTLVEYAEEHGLATGITTNDVLTGATPAACYAHMADRNKAPEIAAQLLEPRFGHGVDVLVGGGHGAFLPKSAGGRRSDERNIIEEMRGHAYRYVETPAEFESLNPQTGLKALALFSSNYEPEAVVEKTISILSKNPHGYFLMVEWDSHQDTAQKCLENALRLDRIAARARKMTDPKDTLLLVTADHSYDLRLAGEEAKIGKSILPHINIEINHTGEEVLVLADGPGAERVHGFMHNTDVFHVMMAAFGWEGQPARRPPQKNGAHR
jgi:alkaline phosphatase